MFWEYRLTCDLLCIGERFKKGLVRPCVRTIPYSTITGALRQEVLGIPSWMEYGHATGCIDRAEDVSFVGGPRDVVTGISKLPLTTQALSKVEGRVYIVYDNDTKHLPPELEFSLGALKSKGFGRVRLVRDGREPREAADPQLGRLNTRVPDDPGLLDKLGIRDVKKAIYGYLFKPTSDTGGVWVRSLFEGSIVEGPQIILQWGETGNDYTRSTI